MIRSQKGLWRSDIGDGGRDGINTGLTLLDHSWRMSQTLRVTVDLPDELLLALGHAAKQARVRPSDYLCTLLAAGLLGGGQIPTAAPAVVRPALLLARDWPDLLRRLRATGLVLRLRDGRLWLCRWPLDEVLMPADEAGLGLADLTLRFVAGFPGLVTAAGVRPARRRVA